MICYPNFNGRLGAIHISDVRPCYKKKDGSRGSSPCIRAIRQRSCPLDRPFDAVFAEAVAIIASKRADPVRTRD